MTRNFEGANCSGENFFIMADGESLMLVDFENLRRAA
jgi:hypothetical protein